MDELQARRREARVRRTVLRELRQRQLDAALRLRVRNLRARERVRCDVEAM
jgi:hypothetical protein